MACLIRYNANMRSLIFSLNLVLMCSLIFSLDLAQVTAYDSYDRKKNGSTICTGKLVYFGSFLPWVPEPQNLNERKLVRGKERRKKGGSGQMITQPRFGAD